MKIIFLDIDGVLNSEQWFEEPKIFPNEYIDPKCLKLVIDLAKTEKAKIVITSVWRTTTALINFLEQKGLDIFDKTPILDEGSLRGEEIQKWLDANFLQFPEGIQFIIIDDIVNILPNHKSHLVLTDARTGIVINDIIRAHEIFEHLNLNTNKNKEA